MNWNIIQMRMIVTIKSDTTPTHHLLTTTLKYYFSIYKFMWPFLWHLNVSGLKKDLLQRGHTNPTPKCTLHMWVQMVAWEVDGHSLKPSTWHWYTHLIPPNWIQRGCMLAGISLSKTEGAVEEVDSSASSVGTEASGSLGSWGDRWEMIEEGALWVFLGGGEDVGMEECDTAPLRSPYKPSTSEPVTATSIFSNPSVSRCWASLSSWHASSCSELAQFSRFSPYKIKGKKGKIRG